MLGTVCAFYCIEKDTSLYPYRYQIRCLPRPFVLQEHAGREIPPVYRDDPAFRLRLIEDVMASLHPAQHKPLLLQNHDDLLGRERRELGMGVDGEGLFQKSLLGGNLLTFLLEVFESSIASCAIVITSSTVSPKVTKSAILSVNPLLNQSMGL